jgi:hyaluronoglucosaminidase
VPQAGNLSLHLELVADGIRQRVPDKNFGGRIVVDFEKWRPTWYHYKRDEDPYHLYSMALVRKQAPGLAGNATAVEELAKEQFEAAGLLFYVETLRLIRAMRPNALAGYFGYPETNMGGCQDIRANQTQYPKECGYDNPAAGVWRASNDRLAPIWAASSALYPSTYLRERGEFDGKGHPQISNASWRARVAVIVGSVVNESARLSATYGGGIPVLPFGWGLYCTHPFDTAVASVDMTMWINAVWQPSLSTGVVLWGYPNSTVQEAAMTTITGPALLAAKKATAACAAARCSGNGWCSDVLPTKTTTCVCRPGWNGTACATAE